MPTTIAEHYSDEITDWRRSIAFYANVVHELTAKLQEVVQRNSIPGIAEKVDTHQRKLDMSMDQFIALHTFFESQEASLKKNSGFIDDGDLDTEAGDRQTDLRERMLKAEKRFFRARNNCLDFLAEIFGQRKS